MTDEADLLRILRGYRVPVAELRAAIKSVTPHTAYRDEALVVAAAEILAAALEALERREPRG